MRELPEVAAELLARIDEIVDSPAPPDEKLQSVCNELYRSVKTYDWVGFYLADGAAEELTLGPFMGAETEHVKIPFGRGVCGRAAAQRRTIIVPDVSTDDNYLSCCTFVRSEIVLPVIAQDGQLAAVLDIDSHTLDAFGEADRDFLTTVSARVAGLL